MRRRASGIFTVASVLALVSLGVMWVRSYWRLDLGGYGFPFVGDDGAYRVRFASVRSADGAVQFGAGYMLPVLLPHAGVREGWFAHRRARSENFMRSEPVWSGAGFAYQRIELTGVLAIRSLGVPYWFLCSCAAAACGVSCRRWRRARRYTGTCATCGYDLRASRGRCPECGTAIAEKGAADNPRGTVKEGVRQS